jgi:hypothetical protein
MTEITDTAGEWTISEARTDVGDFMVVGGEGFGFGVIAAVTTEEDAHLIAAAPAMYEALRQMLDAIESGNIDSPEIGEPENGIPIHKWHEEWEHYARVALQSAKAAQP